MQPPEKELRPASPFLSLSGGAIQAEWTSARTYEERVKNLRGISNPTFDQRLNGNRFLVKNSTVFHDGDADVLNGEAGDDWLFRKPVEDDTAARSRRDEAFSRPRVALRSQRGAGTWGGSAVRRRGYELDAVIGEGGVRGRSVKSFHFKVGG
jgi:hypothetical protein